MQQVTQPTRLTAAYCWISELTTHIKHQVIHCKNTVVIVFTDRVLQDKTLMVIG